MTSSARMNEPHVTATDRTAAPALASRNAMLAIAGLFALYMFGWATRWSFDPTREFGLGRDWFFTAQADAMLRGRLWVDPVALSPGALIPDGNECFWIDGHCYGYWGLTPSLLRVPLLLLFGTFTASLANLMIPLAAGIALFAALDLCRQQTNQMTWTQANVFMAIAAAALGPGSVLVFLADPYVYQEAIIWSVALVLVAVDLFWRWSTGGPNHLLIGAALACIFAAGARPTTMFVGPILAVAVVLKLRSAVFARRLVLASIAVLLVAPAFFAFGIYYAKFGQLSTPTEAYNNPTGTQMLTNFDICVAPVNSVAVENLPTNLFAYLRPDSVRVVVGESPVQFRFTGCVPTPPTLVWPRNSLVGFYPEEHTSISATMPLATCAVAFAAVTAIRRRRWNHLSLLAATGSSLAFVLLVPVLTARYLADFYPMLVVGVASCAGFWSRARRRRTETWLVGAATASLVWSVITVASLFTRYAWLYF